MEFKYHVIHSIKRLNKTYKGLFSIPADIKDEKALKYLAAGIGKVKANDLNSVEIYWNLNMSRFMILNRDRDLGVVVERKLEKPMKIFNKSFYPVDRANKIIHNKPYSSIERYFTYVKFEGDIEPVQGIDIRRNIEDYKGFFLK